jgi:hypothetical protein
MIHVSGRYSATDKFHSNGVCIDRAIIIVYYVGDCLAFNLYSIISFPLMGVRYIEQDYHYKDEGGKCPNASQMFSEEMSPRKCPMMHSYA